MLCVIKALAVSQFGKLQLSKWWLKYCVSSQELLMFSCARLQVSGFRHKTYASPTHEKYSESDWVKTSLRYSLIQTKYMYNLSRTEEQNKKQKNNTMKYPPVWLGLDFAPLSLWGWNSPPRKRCWVSHILHSDSSGKESPQYKPYYPPPNPPALAPLGTLAMALKERSILSPAKTWLFLTPHTST